jgi:hypothetical protein
LAAWQEVDAKLEDLRTSAAHVRDLVLDNDDESSSLAASMSTAVELLEGRIDAVATNEVLWGSCSAMVTTISHFSELKSELELLGSRHKVDLIEDEADALWTRVSAASDSLASYVPSSVAHGPPNNVG